MADALCVRVDVCGRDKKSGIGGFQFTCMFVGLSMFASHLLLHRLVVRSNWFSTEFKFC